MRPRMILLLVALCLAPAARWAQQSASPASQPAPIFSPDDFPQTLGPMPLYGGAIPNSVAAPDEEKSVSVFGMVSIQKVSVPTITAYLPAKNKSAHSAVILFPGGGYTGLSWAYEGISIAEALQDRGVAAIIIKYRLPSDATMQDKSIGPLQDGQQAIRVVRQHAAQWKIDPNRVGVMGFSAGGHLASTVGTHFSKVYVPNPENVDVRPNFMVLVYPVISMTKELTHMGSRTALLGDNPTDAQVRLFSNEQQVTDQTPPTLLLHATDDGLVDVDNSVIFYEALHRHKIPTEAVFFTKGNHGFFGIARDEWVTPLFAWMMKNGWMKP